MINVPKLVNILNTVSQAINVFEVPQKVYHWRSKKFCFDINDISKPRSMPDVEVEICDGRHGLSINIREIKPKN